MLSVDISHSPDSFASRKGSETGIPDFPYSIPPISLPHASLAITLNTPTARQPLRPECYVWEEQRLDAKERGMLSSR
jgi:hypothetical protein